MIRFAMILLTAPLALAIGGCTHAATADRAPADTFLAAIANHCGNAYAGRVVANVPAPTTPDAFEGQALVMHVRGCADPGQRIEIPFHVGDDRSRTWILTRTTGGLQLKHDHRHADGTPDALTMYGGDTGEPGSASRQAFPVDAASIVLFSRDGRSVSTENIWAMEIHPHMFAYELARPRSALNPQGRLFRVEFDLTRPIALPPTPWGW